MAEELGSDEDDIDEDGQEYLEILAKQAGEDGDDEDNPVDEYQIFKALFHSKSLSYR